MEILSTLVNVPEAYTNPLVGSAGGIDGTTGTFDVLTNVEVGDEVVFKQAATLSNEIVPQIEDPITVVSLTSSTVCELSARVIAPDNGVTIFSQLEKSYIIKTDIPGQTTLVFDSIPSINSKKSTLKLKTTSSGLAVATPLSVITK